jgi:ABC-2 type transport system permease protein
MMEHRFPLIPGKDFAGTVEAVGAGVEGFTVGDAVFGVVTKAHLGTGSMAQYVAVPGAIGIAHRLDGVSLRDAGALGLAGTAAFDGLALLGPLEGATVLISGATGGVGAIAVQLAAARGARVIATAKPGSESGFVSALTAVSVSQDMHEGIIDRFRSMDVPSSAVLSGHVASSLLRNAVSVLIIIAIAVAIGFRPVTGPLEWMAAAGVLLAFVLAMTWVSVAFGLLTKSPEGAGGFQFFIMFLPYPSSAFVPVETMPTWLHGFAEHQPATPVIETLRGLLMDTPIGSSGWIALSWCAGIAIVAVAAAGWLFRRRTV